MGGAAGMCGVCGRRASAASASAGGGAPLSRGPASASRRRHTARPRVRRAPRLGTTSDPRWRAGRGS
eukprot:4029095-Prymnesium_polylepis.1